jgi:hypothetical protein
MIKKIGLVVLLTALSGVASAAGACKIEYILGIIPIEMCSPSGNPRSGPAAAPEIDPASAIAGLTLVTGCLAILRGRRSKTKA